MAFFPFQSKQDLGKEFSLEDFPIFSSLTPSEQKVIEKRTRLVEFKRGDIVYEEGTESDAFYVVVSGRFRLFNRARGEKPDQTLMVLYRGDHFGETSLLNSHPHSVSVEAKSDGLILKLDKNDFLKLVREMPGISLYLNRAFGHRLTVSQGGRGPRREVIISALRAKRRDPKIFHFWLDFSRTLAQESKREVIVIDFLGAGTDLLTEVFGRADLPEFLPAQMDPGREADVKGCIFTRPDGYSYMRVNLEGVNDRNEKKIPQLLSFLTYRYDHLMVMLPGDLANPSYQTLKQSDHVYLYVPPRREDLEEAAELTAVFEKGYGFSRNEIKVLVPDEGIDPQVLMTFEDKEAVLNHAILSLIPDRSAESERYRLALRFIAKELSGNLVGLALGSGAAYGLAHIGVIKALEREGITIDVVSGSSMGALVGALWAGGHDAAKLQAIAESIDKRTGFFKLLGFKDFSIAHHGFFKGNQVHHFLEPYLGAMTFQDLKIPLRIVATNLFTAEQVIFRAGKVTDAVRASVSIPGIFRPVQHKAQHLIDGGVVDPLPVRVLAGMGVKKIIAVNVLPSPKDWSRKHQLQQEQLRRKREDAASQKGFRQFWGSSLERLQRHYSGNIFNVIMNTIQFMEFEIAAAAGRKADLLIHPVVSDAHWAQFYYPQKFIKAGEDAADEQMAEIKRLVSE